MHAARSRINDDGHFHGALSPSDDEIDGHKRYNAGRLTGADGTVREKRRRPSKHVRIFGPITGIDGTEFIPCISRAGFRLPGKYGQNTGPCFPGFFPVQSTYLLVVQCLILMLNQ